MRRLPAVAGLVAVLAATVLSLPAAASTATPGTARAGACPGSSGVTVVVDFGSLGGGTVVACAPGDPDSGLAALQGAGFSIGFVPGVPGMVCAIDNEPDPCNGAPADAYWAYYHAARGGSWNYSNSGAHVRDPAPGSVEGWAFGAGRAPSVRPPSAPTTTTTTTTTSRATTTTRPPAVDTGGGTTAPPTTRPATSGPETTPGTNADGPASTDGPGDEPPEPTEAGPGPSDPDDQGDAAGDDGDDVRVDNDAEDEDEEAGGEVVITDEDDDGGSGAMVAAIGGGATLALAGAGFWQARRRSTP